MSHTNWIAQDTSAAKYLGVIEIDTNNGETEIFTVVHTDTHIVFGGWCNIGLLESGNMLIDECFSIDENLCAVVENLETFYSDGGEYCYADFTYNDRM